MGKVNPKYKYEDYLTIHQLVLDYQAQKHGSAEKLILAFDGFLWKFVNCISRGSFEIENYSLRKFISLFVTDNNAKGQLNAFRHKPFIKETIEEAVQKVKMLFSQYTEAEIRAEIVCIFLDMAKKYKDYEKPSFHNYIAKCFHFTAFRSLITMMTDPNMKSIDEVKHLLVDINVEKQYQAAMEEMNHLSDMENSDLPVLKSTHSPFNLESLDINWVNGITCGDIFHTLTPFERNLLVMAYIDGQSDTEIGKIYGLCRATINRKKLIAKDKLVLCLNIQ